MLEQAATHLEEGKERWREERRKLNSFDALAQRQQQVQAREDARREQRLNDEYSARLVRGAAGLH